MVMSEIDKQTYFPNVALEKCEFKLLPRAAVEEVVPAEGGLFWEWSEARSRPYGAARGSSWKIACRARRWLLLEARAPS